MGGSDVKFDLFIDYSDVSFRIGHYTGKTSNNISWINGAQVYYNKVYINYGASRYGKGIPLIMNKTNSIWFHIFSDGLPSSSTKTFFELIVNDSDKEVTKFQYSSELFNYNYNAITIVGDKHCFLSNIIISDSFIDPKEQVVFLPIEDFDTNMSNSNNNFIANEDGQYADFFPDVSSLVHAFGEDSTVTAISFIAAPACKSGAALSNLMCHADIDDFIISSDMPVSDDALSGVSYAQPVNFPLKKLAYSELSFSAKET